MARRFAQTWYMNSISLPVLEKRFVAIYDSLSIGRWFPNLTKTLFEKHVSDILTILYKPFGSTGMNFIQTQNYATSDIFKRIITKNIRYANKVYLADNRQMERDFVQYTRQKVFQGDKKWQELNNNQILSVDEKTQMFKSFQENYPMFLLSPSSDVYLDKRHVYIAAWTEFVQQLTTGKIPITFEDADFVSDEETFQKINADRIRHDPVIRREEGY